MLSDAKLTLKSTASLTSLHRIPLSSSFGVYFCLCFALLRTHPFISPRGWHLEEPRVLIDNEPVSGAIFDFALYFFHNAKELVARGFGPYFYLPKMEHYKEARLWNDIFNFSQSYIGLPHGTVRGTVLIETLPAAFQMEEILFELREHSSGLNCGRYVTEFIRAR